MKRKTTKKCHKSKSSSKGDFGIIPELVPSPKKKGDKKCEGGFLSQMLGD